MEDVKLYCNKSRRKTNHVTLRILDQEVNDDKVQVNKLQLTS